jgi:hypothetical protein
MNFNEINIPFYQQHILVECCIFYYIFWCCLAEIAGRCMEAKCKQSSYKISYQHVFFHLHPSCPAAILDDQSVVECLMWTVMVQWKISEQMTQCVPSLPKLHYPQQANWASIGPDPAPNCLWLIAVYFAVQLTHGINDFA